MCIYTHIFSGLGGRMAGEQASSLYCTPVKDNNHDSDIDTIMNVYTYVDLCLMLDSPF